MRDPGPNAPSLLLPPCCEEMGKTQCNLEHETGRILDWDLHSGILTAEAGVTMEQLCKAVIGHGFWPPVAPPTMKATLGECAARNVCGSNQFRAGSFGSHVIGFELRLAGGETLWCSREQHAELFYAAIGGYGILGDILRLRLKMKKVHSGWLQVEAVPTRDIFMMMDEFEKRQATADALAGWVDTLARGDLGRGILYQADPLAADGIRANGSGLNSAEQEHPQREWKEIRAWLARPLRGLAFRPGVKLLHALKYRQAQWQKRGQRRQQALAAFTFPLDASPCWQWTPSPGILAQRSLVQYPCVVPRAQARHAFAQLLKVSQESRLTSCGATLMLRRADPFLLSSGIDGYALAIAFAPGRNEQEDYQQLTREMDAIVFEHGGVVELGAEAPGEAEALKRSVSRHRLAEMLRIKEEYNLERLRPCGLIDREAAGKPGRTSQQAFKISRKSPPRSGCEKLPAA